MPSFPLHQPVDITTAPAVTSVEGLRAWQDTCPPFGALHPRPETIARRRLDQLVDSVWSLAAAAPTQ